jgi:hypothetical protein
LAIGIRFQFNRKNEVERRLRMERRRSVGGSGATQVLEIGLLVQDPNRSAHVELEARLNGRVLPLLSAGAAEIHDPQIEQITNAHPQRAF